ncbi:MAG: hypothetical protein M1352_02110 [Patescibacteria group bacterium]|nr:hypothetical protein [Patescibacteria group bacterium]
MNVVFATASATPSGIAVGSIVADFFGGLPFYLFNLFFLSYLVFLWVFLVRWVGQDALRRGIEGSRRQAYMILVLIFSFPGLFLYLLLRPPLTLDEQKRAEMEEEVITLELEKLRRESTSRTPSINSK